jgi:hypothetical protein
MQKLLTTEYLLNKKLDTREMELQWFVQNLEGDPPELIARKIWLHSRWYEAEHYFKILDVAKDYDARMTFCFLGRDIPYRKHIISRMIEEGHEVASHGPRHYLINERFDYDRMYQELKPCIEELRALVPQVNGLWLSNHGELLDSAAKALADLGIEWFSSGVSHHDMRPPEGLRYVPMLEPHDFDILFVDPVPVGQALAQWKEMSVHNGEGLFLFHPFILTMLDPEIMEAWKGFLTYTGGSVPVTEHPDSDGRPAILVDGSLHLHID